MLPEVRMARVIDAIGLHRSRELSCEDAATLLGMSERHFRRLRDAFEARGAEGILDGRRGRASGRRAPVDEIAWVVEQFRTRYFGFTAKHFHEAVRGQPMAGGRPLARGYTWTKGVLQERGLVSKAPRRSAHRKKRERKPMVGMMLFQDGSRYAWLPEGPELDLVATLDDATSRVLSIVLVEEEGTASIFTGLREVIGAHGLFSSFYTDRGSHSLPHAQGGRKGGPQPAHAGGPGAGAARHRAHRFLLARGARAHGTAVRHPAEAAAARAADGRPHLDGGHQPLAREVYRAEHNARFAVEPAEAGSAFVPFVGDLAAVLCVQDERTVGHDNTVRYGGRVLQIPEQAHRRHFVKATVRVHEHPDGTLAVFQGPRQLARTTATGSRPSRWGRIIDGRAAGVSGGRAGQRQAVTLPLPGLPFGDLSL